MLSFPWWALPAVLECVIAACCVYVASFENKGVPGATLAAVAFFILGTLICGGIAGALRVLAVPV